jgi:hypothetical protein
MAFRSIVFYLALRACSRSGCPALMRMHLAICEVRDINDEMKRRISARDGPKRT